MEQVNLDEWNEMSMKENVQDEADGMKQEVDSKDGNAYRMSDLCQVAVCVYVCVCVCARIAIISQHKLSEQSCLVSIVLSVFINQCYCQRVDLRLEDKDLRSEDKDLRFKDNDLQNL